MHGQNILMLISLFVSAVTSQSSECTDAVRTLEANQACNNAYNELLRFVGFTRDSLNLYCQPSCYDLVGARIRACTGDADAVSRFYDTRSFTCAINAADVSCWNYTFFSPEYRSLFAAFMSSGTCPHTIPDGQTCSQSCQLAFQNFVIDGGCCVGESVRLVRQYAALINTYFPSGNISNIITHCPVDSSRAGTCTIIGGATAGDGSGGANGLKAFGSILLFTVTFAVAAF